MEIKPVVSRAVSSSINTLNEIGSATISTVAKAKSSILKNIPNDTYEKAKNAGICKETAVGLGISATALVLAAKCVKEIKSSLHSLKHEK